MAGIARAQLFRVAHDHLDRAAGGLGQVIAEWNVHERVLAAKVAADESDLKHHFFRRYAEPFCEMLFVKIGLFGRSANENSIRRIDLNNCCVGDRKSTRLNSSHVSESRMPSSA